MIALVWCAACGANSMAQSLRKRRPIRRTGLKLLSEETLADAGQRHFANVPLDQIRTGDLLLFRWKPHLPAKHAGIATSATTMIHAQDGARVCEITLTPWWRSRLAYAFRFPGVDD